MNNGLMFSIVIPTYNRANFILKAVESYLQQDYSNLEIIVVDDGSTDNTKEVLSTIKDRRVTYHYKENSERGAARNYGASLAKGDYINFCDSDDYVYKNHLSVARDFIAKKNSPVFHLGHQIVHNEKIEFTENRTGVLNQYILKGNIFILNSVFIKKRVALENPFIEDRDLAGSEDYLQWLLLSAKFNIQGCEEVTSALVQHDGRSMQYINGEKTLERIGLIKKYLQESVSFQNQYKNEMPVIFSSMDLFMALEFALEKSRIPSLKYLAQSISSDPKLIFRRRVLAVLKHLILRW